MSQIKVNSIIPVSGVPTGGGGGVVQTIMGEQRSNVSFSIASGATSSSAALSAQITPTSNTSKVKISGNITCGLSNPSNSVYIKIYKDGSSLSASSSSESAGSRQTGVHASNIVDHSWQMASIPFSFLDSPSTTSQITYQIYVSHSSGGSQNVYINYTSDDSNNSAYARAASFMILEEVSA
tara:strand:+ start:32 stop:574 length:543 start_codon:yes stop_codon:yes gene_type:complete